MNNIQKNIEDMIGEFGSHQRWVDEFEYGYKWAPEESISLIIALIEKYKPLPVDNILEIAIGYGRVSKLLYKKCINLYGIDINQCCVDYCSSIMPNAKFTTTDGITLPRYLGLDLAYIQFDLIISYDSMVHIDKEIIKIYLNQIKTSLKPFGVCVIHHSANGINEIGNRSNMNAKYMEEWCKDMDLKLVDQILSYPIAGVYNDCLSIISNG